MNNVLQEIVYIIVGNEPNYPEGGGCVSVAICQRQDDKEWMLDLQFYEFCFLFHVMRGGSLFLSASYLKDVWGYFLASKVARASKWSLGSF